MNRLPLFALVFALPAPLLTPGCAADDNTQSPPPVDAAAFLDATRPASDAAIDSSLDSSADGSTCSSNAASSCVNLATPTTAVIYGTSSGALPIASGGAITAGLYALASQTTYTTSPAASDAGAPTATSAVSFDSCAHFVLTSFSTSASASTVGGTYSVSGTTLRLVEDCPNVQALTPVLYTATATTVTLTEPADPLTGNPAVVSTYQLQ